MKFRTTSATAETRELTRSRARLYYIVAPVLLALISGGAISARAQEIDTGGARERHSGRHVSARAHEIKTGAHARHSGAHASEIRAAGHHNRHKSQPVSQPAAAPTPGLDAQQVWKNTGADFNAGNSWVSGVAPTTGDVGAFNAAAVTQPGLSAGSTSIAGLYFTGANTSGYTLSRAGAQALTLTGNASSIGLETGNTNAVAIGAENTSGTNTISAPFTLAPASPSTTSTISQAGGGTLVISGVISGSGINLTKIGTGTLTLTGADTYSGATTISGGTLKLDNNNTTTARLASTTGITVNSGGTLLLAQSGVTASTNRINDAATVTLNGGTFNTGGLSERGGTNSLPTAGMGALTLTATSTIDFGTGSTSKIEFSGVGAHTVSTILQIINWDGTPTTGGGNEALLFAGTSSAFTNIYSQSDVIFNGGTAGYLAVQFTGFYEITEVPEPGTWLAAALTLVGLVYFQRRRFLRVISRR